MKAIPNTCLRRTARFPCLLLAATLSTGLALAQAPKPQALSPAEAEKQTLLLLAAGRQADAEDLLNTSVALYRTDQRLLFLRGACMRSRFDVQRAAVYFRRAVALGTNTVSGKCSLYVLQLDTNTRDESGFKPLLALAQANPDDTIVRWMAAVQCRARNENEEGVKLYRALATQWRPGPVLMHQTYANLLDALDRFEESLIERRIAVSQEPSAWTYQGLGNTLASLRRFSEANEAYSKSTALAPDGGAYWRAWAWGLAREGNCKEAIVKCEMAVACDPEEWTAWRIWGDCLLQLGLKRHALEKYRKAQQGEPSEYLQGEIARLEGALAAEQASATNAVPALSGIVPPSHVRSLQGRNLGHLITVFGNPQKQVRDDRAIEYVVAPWRDWDQVRFRVASDGRLAELSAVRYKHGLASVPEWSAALKKDFGIAVGDVWLVKEHLPPRFGQRYLVVLQDTPPGARQISLDVPARAVDDPQDRTIDTITPLCVVSNAIRVTF